MDEQPLPTFHRFGSPANSGGVPWLCGSASRRGCLVVKTALVSDRIDAASPSLERDPGIWGADPTRPLGDLALRRAQRLVLSTARTPLRHLWALVYRAVAHAVGRALTRGEPGAAVYTRASLGGSEFLPGLSDVDLAIVLATDEQADRARGRWRRHGHVLSLGGLVDQPFIYGQAELQALAGKSALTYDGVAFGGPRGTRDAIRTLQRPELDGGKIDTWQPLRGPDRRPPRRPADVQERRIAAWFELVYWWRFAFPACVGPPAPWLASRCVKLVAEPGRVWLALEHDERPATRADVLRLLLRRLPEEETALRATLELQRTLHRSPDPALATVLPVLLRLSERIAAVLAAQLADAPVTEVALAGETGALPLADWRALVAPPAADERLAPITGDPVDPAVLGAAVLDHLTGPYPVMRSGQLLLLPGAEFVRTRMRAIQCRLTDPVSFALLEGARTASFPDVAGWSIHDTARRAVAEHAARLRSEPGDLELLLTATRAALLHESVARGEPELVLTGADAIARLPGDAAAEALHGAAPAALAALREQVLALPAYASARI